MWRPSLARRLSSGIFRHRGFPSSPFSTDASPAATPQLRSPLHPPPHRQQRHQGTATASPEPPPPDEPPSAAATAAEELRQKRSNRTKGGSHREQHARVLRAALGHVMKLGWGDSALIAGARDAGLSPSIVGSFPGKEAALVEFFMDDRLEKLIDKIDFEELDLNNLILSERLSKLIRIRLEMQAPYISKWAQALSIQAQPMNIPTSFKQRAALIDEVWHAAGDQTSDVDWYIKHTVLGVIYSTSEVHMLTDNSPGFQDTWVFLDHRIKGAFEIQKTFQDAAYLAEAVGAGIGNSTQAFMEKMLQGLKM